MSKKYLYYFSEGNDAFGGDKVTMKNILGGKGAGLAEMTAAGMLTSSSTSRASRRSPARPSATTRTRCWSPSAPAHVSPCPA